MGYFIWKTALSGIIQRFIYAIFYAFTDNWAHPSKPSRYFDSLRKFKAPILNPNRCFILIFPLTGIWFIPYRRRRIDGMVSTPFLIRAMILKCSVFIMRCDFARLDDFSETCTVAFLLPSLGLHFSRKGQFSHIFLLNLALHLPVLLTYWIQSRH